MRADGARQCPAVRTGNRCFARAVHIREHQRLTIRQHLGKIIQTIAGAGKAVRLEHRKNPPSGKAFLRCCQYRANLVRVMPIILEHLRRTVLMCNHAVIRKTPPDALELAQPGDNILMRQPQLAAHNQRRERVQHIMLARHGQRQRERLAACLIDHIKQHIQADLTHIHRAQIRLLRKTIRAHRPPDLGQYRAHPLIIHTHHRQPVERQIVQKAHKTLLQIIETAAVILQMIRINIRHHRNHRLQKQKRRIRLIRFRDQILTVAQTRITACRREHPANDKRRV